MDRRSSRREFLKRSARAGIVAAAGGYWISFGAARGAPATGPSDKLNLGIIGTGGRAQQNLNEEDNAVASENIVALCDVDEKIIAPAAKRFPKATTYADYRKLLDRKDIDGVVISTADHTHASAALLALQSGKHVYCEKPLTHTVHEARLVTEAAAKYKRVTQMGTQIHAGSNHRRVVELVRSGAIGAVREVHVMLAGKIWGAKEPAAHADPPAYLNYDLWLGPVPHRPYRSEYHPQSWRKYWAFGNGTLGDMGCHFIDLPFWALRLRHPTKVRAEGPPVHPEVCPEWLVVHYDFPARRDEAGVEQPPVKLTWYDGGKRPEAYDSWNLGPYKSGVVFVGEKGNLFADYNRHKLLSEEKFEDFPRPPRTIPESIGHHREWLEACRRNDPTATSCHFGYSGPLTETVLLGTVAYRSGKELTWDAQRLATGGGADVDAFLRQEVRGGWGV